MNEKRHLAFFTACNIDGRSLKAIDRKTGTIEPRRAGEAARLESLAEASEVWFDDDRLDDNVTTPQELYSGQEVPGYPNKQTRDWQNRMFQRGHLVRRTDPAWGPDSKALRADADTGFHVGVST